MSLPVRDFADHAQGVLRPVGFGRIAWKPLVREIGVIDDRAGRFDEVDSWVHDPAVGGWVKRAPMPTPRSGGGKAVIDGKIYVAGGRPPGGSAFEVYDPATDKWEKLPDLPTQGNHLAMVALNGKIIVAGGATSSRSPRARPPLARWSTSAAPLSIL